MSLPILALAFAFYIVGIAVILYLRPSLMFQPGGDWKEFGIGRGESHTVLPFWLFAIFWAFISYGLSLVILSQFAHVATSTFSAPVHAQPQMSQQVPQAQQQAVTQAVAQPVGQPQVYKPVSSMIGLAQNQPGYYVLANNSQTGNPQYIYYGNNPPALSKY